MRYCGHFLIKVEGGAKNYKPDHPLPLAWRSFTVEFVQRKGYSTTGYSITGYSTIISSVYIALTTRLRESNRARFTSTYLWFINIPVRVVPH